MFGRSLLYSALDYLGSCQSLVFFGKEASELTTLKVSGKVLKISLGPSFFLTVETDDSTAEFRYS